MWRWAERFFSMCMKWKAEPTTAKIQARRSTRSMLRLTRFGSRPEVCSDLNVALGGTLFQHVHEVEGRADHREDPGAPLDAQYAPAHPVRVAAGSLLRSECGAGRNAFSACA